MTLPTGKDAPYLSVCVKPRSLGNDRPDRFPSSQPHSADQLVVPA